jgi:hypothetical protein
MRGSFVLFAAILGLLPSAVAAQVSWADYSNSLYGYSIEYPAEGFSISQSEKGLSLIEDGGRGQIDVYGAANVDQATPRKFEAVLRKADRIRRVTYSRGGGTWLAISGYYRREGDVQDGLIFYAKFMFSLDLSHLAAFEASYPVEDKKRYAPIIERMEDTLTAPH